ncbi:hypothetical protein HYH03_007008 [Edaphochlamys debaryana]|uniref:Guanylate cyclase domain-containing protein n=1 Tax=Edaphochlamys debaryana TaxID=47281 RepID=A0A835Y2L1_9CHLO|nr:hypothetical protein HYH03_007008 [Edaphochlamys debaryana]|eukprot:KAG2494763.1 hypothetical protein HYH03_007008 [Edaphochlamys debaryana]
MAATGALRQVAGVLGSAFASYPNVIRNTWTVPQSLDDWEQRLSDAASGGAGLAADGLVASHTVARTLLSRGLLADLTGLTLLDTTIMRWGVHPLLVEMTRSDNQVLGVPLDGSQLMLYVRLDVFRAAGLEAPGSWQQLLQVAERLNGTEAAQQVAGAPRRGPIFGFCLPPSARLLAQLALAVLAPMVQTGGSHAGMYLNAATLRPASATPAMSYVLSYIRRLAAFAAPVSFSATAPPFSDDFALGRCAMALGSAAQFRRNSHAAHPAGPSAVKGSVAASLLPGSELVLGSGPAGEGLVRCTPELCPYAALVSPLPGTAGAAPPAASQLLRLQQGAQPQPQAQQAAAQAATSTHTLAAAADAVLVNRAPLLSPDGLVAAIVSSSAELIAQLYSWLLLSTVGSPGSSSWALLLHPSSEVGPWRIDHFAAGPGSWAAAGYDGADAASFLTAARASLDHPNVVWPLRIRGAVEHNHAVRTAVEAVAAAPGASVVTSADQDPEVAAAMRNLTAAVTSLFGSGVPDPALRAEYRSSLLMQDVHGGHTETAAGNPSEPGEGSSSRVGLAVGVSLGSALLAVLALGFCYLKTHRRRRSSTGYWALVEAPKPGPATCIAVTDIEGSTSLWEALPEAVLDGALRTHHRVVRTASALHRGYESATEGDSFILVFETPVAAAEFAVALQQALLEAEWPEELLAAPTCRPVFVQRRDDVEPPGQVSFTPSAVPKAQLPMLAAGFAGMGVLASAGAGARAGAGGSIARQKTAWDGYSAAVMSLTGNRAASKRKPSAEPHVSGAHASAAHTSAGLAAAAKAVLEATASLGRGIRRANHSGDNSMAPFLQRAATDGDARGGRRLLPGVMGSTRIAILAALMSSSRGSSKGRGSITKSASPAAALAPLKPWRATAGSGALSGRGGGLLAGGFASWLRARASGRGLMSRPHQRSSLDLSSNAQDASSPGTLEPSRRNMFAHSRLGTTPASHAALHAFVTDEKPLEGGQAGGTPSDDVSSDDEEVSYEQDSMAAPTGAVAAQLLMTRQSTLHASDIAELAGFTSDHRGPRDLRFPSGRSGLPPSGISSASQMPTQTLTMGQLQLGTHSGFGAWVQHDKPPAPASRTKSSNGRAAAATVQPPLSSGEQPSAILPTVDDQLAPICSAADSQPLSSIPSSAVGVSPPHSGFLSALQPPPKQPSRMAPRLLDSRNSEAPSGALVGQPREEVHSMFSRLASEMGSAGGPALSGLGSALVHSLSKRLPRLPSSAQLSASGGSTQPGAHPAAGSPQLQGVASGRLATVGALARPLEPADMGPDGSMSQLGSNLLLPRLSPQQAPRSAASTLEPPRDSSGAHKAADTAQSPAEAAPQAGPSSRAALPRPVGGGRAAAEAEDGDTTIVLPQTCQPAAATPARGENRSEAQVFLDMLMQPNPQLLSVAQAPSVPPRRTAGLASIERSLELGQAPAPPAMPPSAANESMGSSTAASALFSPSSYWMAGMLPPLEEGDPYTMESSGNCIVTQASARVASKPAPFTPAPGSLLAYIHKLFAKLEEPVVGRQADDAVMVFAGLRVRVGLHCGVQTRDIVYNQASARQTFGGEGLRVAKAVTDCASGGQVVLSSEVLCQLQVAGAMADLPGVLMDLGDHQLFEATQTARPSQDVPAGGNQALHLAAPAMPVSRHLLQLAPPGLLGRLSFMPPVRSAIHQYTPGFMDAPVGDSVAVVVFRVSHASALLAWSAAVAAESMALLELYLRASLGPLLPTAAADLAPPGPRGSTHRASAPQHDSVAGASGLPPSTKRLPCYLAAAPPGSPFGTFVAGFTEPAAAARWALQAVARMADLPWPSELLQSPRGAPLEGITLLEAETIDGLAGSRRMGQGRARTPSQASGQIRSVTGAGPALPGGHQCLSTMGSLRCSLGGAADPSAQGSGAGALAARTPGGPASAGADGSAKVPAASASAVAAAAGLGGCAPHDGGATSLAGAAAGGRVVGMTLEVLPCHPVDACAELSLNDGTTLQSAGMGTMSALLEATASVGGAPHDSFQLPPAGGGGGGGGGSLLGLPFQPPPLESVLSAPARNSVTARALELVPRTGPAPLEAGGGSFTGPARTTRMAASLSPNAVHPATLATEPADAGEVCALSAPDPAAATSAAVGSPAGSRPASAKRQLFGWSGRALNGGVARSGSSFTLDSTVHRKGAGRSSADRQDSLLTLTKRSASVSRPATMVPEARPAGANNAADSSVDEGTRRPSSAILKTMSPVRRAALKGDSGRSGCKSLTGTAGARSLAQAAEDAEVVTLRGLRVRLGLAVGAVRVELCPMTGRVVYSGKTVTAAMTAAAAARLGALYATQAAAEAIVCSQAADADREAGDVGVLGAAAPRLEGSPVVGQVPKAGMGVPSAWLNHKTAFVRFRLTARH